MSATGAGGGSITVDISGAEKMIRMLNEMQKSPQKAITSAAGKAATQVKRAIKQGTVPVGATGNLKKAIVRKAEKSRKRGRKVYDVTFDSAYNEVLQKPIQNPGEAGGKNPKAYYPASQEYGFLTRSKGNGITYVEGLHFMKKGADESEKQAMDIMMDTLGKELDKIWQKAQHG